MKDKECTVTAIRNNPGIFYEAIGEVRTSEISWKTIIYVDLADIVRASIALHREINSAIKKCNDIAEICTSQKLLLTLTHELQKVTQYYEHIRELIGETKIKRAPLEFIGQISKILFGTLTTEDAHHITTAIEHVENKTNDLATLLINQTIATRARFGELYNATLEIREQQTQLYKYRTK